MKAGRVVAVFALVLVVVVMGACAAALIVFPRQTAALVKPVFPGIAEAIHPSQGAQENSAADRRFDVSTDANLPTGEEEATYQQAHKGRPKTNPLIAQCSGIDLRCPVAPADLVGVLFHQASYGYALVMTTELPEANIEAISQQSPARVNHEQSQGDWLDAEAMHLWRSGDVTSMDTSIDIGAAAGTAIRSPVTGTVVLVKDYLLYEETPDVEIHIQPDGRPDLDVVMIHTDGTLVKAGDRVVAGETKVSHVRDIAAVLTDVQLGYYTQENDPGNHTHIQVNDVNYPEYREKRLEGAITV